MHSLVLQVCSPYKFNFKRAPCLKLSFRAASNRHVASFSGTHRASRGYACSWARRGSATDFLSGGRSGVFFGRKISVSNGRPR